MRGLGIPLAFLLALVPSVIAQDAPLSEGERAWLEENGPLRVALLSDAPPWAAYDPAHGWSGLDVEAMQLTALKAGFDVTFVPAATGPEAIELVENGTVHATGSFAARPDLTSFAVRTDSYAEVPFVFFTTDDHPEFQALDDIEGRVSAFPGSVGEEIIKRSYPHLTYVETGIEVEGVWALVNGTIDAYAMPVLSGAHLGQREGLSEIRPVGDPIFVTPFYFWSHGNQPVVHEILQAGRERITDTELGVLHVKWTGYDLRPGPAPTTRLPTWALPAGGLLMV
ncbi:MAG: transporter substrate-binding domain-containing protein, partial [Candidatus Thermoplasmatota archaeon]|nr:transporter substrate-binding domain-containing protein [Candidatus Thermoplasmatota archaeon]